LLAQAQKIPDVFPLNLGLHPAAIVLEELRQSVDDRLFSG
jgi:hypothetical protein